MQSSAPSSAGILAECKTRLTLEASAISRAWPIRPKPVTSVRAWTVHVATAALGCPAEVLQIAKRQDEADARGERHFASVADQAEAGDVGEGMDSPRSDSRPRLSCGASFGWADEGVRPYVAGDDHLGRCFIQRCHRLYRGVDPLLLGYAFLDRRRNYSRAQRLGEQQAVAGLRTLIGKDALRINHPGDRVSELR